MWKEITFQCLIAVLATDSLANAFFYEDQLEKDETIETVNNAHTTWKAGRNFHPSLKSGYSQILLGYKKRTNGFSFPDRVDHDDEIDLPDTFDARDKWRRCTGLNSIRDQGNCGSCWAVSSASVFTDRLCIASKGQFNEQLSARDLMSCVPGGCRGGYPAEAFEYFEHSGICTGGDYKSNQGCQPYPFPNCEHKYATRKHNYKRCSGHILPTPKCRHTCTNKKYNTTRFQRDLHFIKTNSSFSIRHDIRKMQLEIYKNGPLVAAFAVYEDFFSYKIGVYKHTTGLIQGYHAVKIIGWGVEEGTDYWLVANSWNTDWGNNGYFKIRRGNNECGFEEDVVGGIPDVQHEWY